MQRVVDTPFGEIVFELEYKNVKNINLRVVRGGAVKVSAPGRIPEAAVDGFVKQKAGFIRSAVIRLGSLPQKDAVAEYNDGELVRIFGRDYRVRLFEGKKNRVEIIGDELAVHLRCKDDLKSRQRCVQKYLASVLFDAVKTKTDEVYPIFAERGIAYPELKIKRMRSRWGSCHTKKGIVSYAAALIEHPLECVEYVVMHEMVHFIHPNHSPAFHGQMSRLMPDWRERRLALRRGDGK